VWPALTVVFRVFMSMVHDAMPIFKGHEPLHRFPGTSMRKTDTVLKLGRVSAAMPLCHSLFQCSKVLLSCGGRAAVTWVLFASAVTVVVLFSHSPTIVSSDSTCWPSALRSFQPVAEFRRVGWWHQSLNNQAPKPKRETVEQSDGAYVGCNNLVIPCAEQVIGWILRAVVRLDQSRPPFGNSVPSSVPPTA
jgi:hypothetical protein